MSILRPRNRVVYFRVSEDEFHRFRSICESRGARSVSDLARSAMHSMIHDATCDHESQLSNQLTVLENMVSDLNQKVHQLTLSLTKPDPEGGTCDSSTNAPSNNRTET